MIDDSRGDIIIYQAEDGLTKIDVKIENETVWLSQQQNQIDYKPNADILLHLLKRKGYILALATNIQLDIYRTENHNIKQKVDIDKIFNLILTQDDVIEKKPSPEVHNKILQKFNVKPEECLIIEDSLIGVQAGINAGIDVAVIYDQYSDSDREKINRLAQYKFNNFSELINLLQDELESVM